MESQNRSKALHVANWNGRQIFCQRPLALSVGRAAPTALLLRRVVVTGKPDDKTVVIDGKPDEPFWKLDQAIAKQVEGTPTKQAFFGAVWTHQPRGDSKLIGRHVVLRFGIQA